MSQGCVAVATSGQREYEREELCYRCRQEILPVLRGTSDPNSPYLWKIRLSELRMEHGCKLCAQFVSFHDIGGHYCPLNFIGQDEWGDCILTIWACPDLMRRCDCRRERPLIYSYPLGQEIVLRLKVHRPSLSSTRADPSSDIFDVGSMQGWLDICKDNHPTCSSDQAPTNLRCLDVTNGRLVKLGRSDSFVALSYAWGQKPLERKDFLCNNHVSLEKLPRTIRDAVTVTARLGEQHLWVDCICVDSSDEQDFQHQINQMNEIYSAAVVTLVAIAGSNNEEGLPRVEMSSSCRAIDKVVTRTAIFINSPYSSLYLESRRGSWSKRGWTLQEVLVSSRCIYFGKYETFFHCREGYASAAAASSPSSPTSRNTAYLLCDRDVPRLMTSSW